MTAQTNATTPPSLQDMAGAMGLALHPSDPAAITTISTQHSQPVSDGTDGTDEAALLDLDEFMGDETAHNPEANRSRPALYNSGLAKAGLVGTIGLAVCLSGAGVFKLMTPGAKVATEPVQDEAVPEDPRQAQLAQAQSAASRSQAQLALQTQQQEMARLLDDAAFSEGELTAKEELINPDTENEPKGLQRDAVTPVTVKPQPPPRSPRITPAKFTQSTPAPIAAQPISRSVQPKPLLTQIAPPVAPIRPTFSDTRPTAAPVDPMAEWQRLATAGRYGSVPADERASVPALGVRSPLNTDAKAGDNATTTVASTSKASTRLRAKRPLQTALPRRQEQQNQPIQPPRPYPQVASIFPAAPGFGNGSGNVYQSRSARSTVLASAPSSVPSSTVASVKATPAYRAVKPKPVANYDVDATLAEEWGEFETVSSPLSDTVEQPGASFAIADTVARTLSIGTSAPGQTVTPIIWAPGSIGSDAHFVVLLSEALVDTQGEAVIPEGSQLIVQTQSHDPASGLAELDVVSIVIGGQEFTPPAGSIVIRDEQGGLLMGQDFYGNRNGSVSGDLWRVAAGALGQAGALMNQPQRTSRSSVATVGGSSSSETIEQGQPNYLGAAMEGGFGVLSDVMDRRQQSAAQALAEAPKLYHLPANYPLRIFVNRSMSF